MQGLRKEEQKPGRRKNRKQRMKIGHIVEKKGRRREERRKDSWNEDGKKKKRTEKERHDNGRKD